MQRVIRSAEKKTAVHAQALKEPCSEDGSWPHWSEAPGPRGSRKIKDQNEGDIAISACGSSNPFGTLSEEEIVARKGDLHGYVAN
jgi:hypothetical protein